MCDVDLDTAFVHYATRSCINDPPRIVNTENAPHVCALCSHSDSNDVTCAFATLDELRTHRSGYAHRWHQRMQLAEGDGEFACALCQRAWRDEKFLRYHVQQRHPNALFVCKTCQQVRFVTKAAYEMHMLAHEIGEKLSSHTTAVIVTQSPEKSKENEKQIEQINEVTKEIEKVDETTEEIGQADEKRKEIENVDETTPSTSIATTSQQQSQPTSPVVSKETLPLDPTPTRRKRKLTERAAAFNVDLLERQQMLANKLESTEPHSPITDADDPLLATLPPSKRNRGRNR